MADDDSAVDDTAWHLLIHSPGPNADPEVPFFQADWFPGHRGFHAELQKAGYFVAAGPLPEREGAGQTLVRGVSTAEITRLARETDPAVIGGFLVVEIVPWRVVESILE
ncbi:MAG: YciI family protein [Microbacteriaceae bacterium]